MATRPAPQDIPRPIVIRRVRKVAGGAHHGGAWKVAYADFVTAMMAFFMLLWLLANPDKEQLKGLAKYFSPSTASSKPGEAIDSISGDTAGLGGQRQRAQAAEAKASGRPSMDAATAGAARGGTANVPDVSLRVMAEELKLLLQPSATSEAERQAVQMEPSRDGLRVSLMDDGRRSMFRAGTAELNAYARHMLAKLARTIGRSGGQVAVEGHTDAAGGVANWKLSADRALAAHAALIAGGLPSDRVSEVIAKGATEPVYPDQPLRPENRRITIVILGQQSALPSDSSFRF